MRSIPENDWKQLRAIQSEKLALAGERILAAAEGIAKQRKDNEHESFLKLWDETNKGNRLIAELFDDLRRSNAIFKLIAWRRNNY
ncbi:MAG: hypothetical protein WBM58_03685 [Sedimenticolaceae bacterium]